MFFLHCFAEKLEIKVASGCNDLPDRFRAADPKPNVVTHGVLVKAKVEGVVPSGGTNQERARARQVQPVQNPAQQQELR